MMFHSVIRDHHALISVLSMKSFVFPIFSSTAHMDEHVSLLQWSLGLFAILFYAALWEDFQATHSKSDNWCSTRRIHPHLSILVVLTFDRRWQQLIQVYLMTATFGERKNDKSDQQWASEFQSGNWNQRVFSSSLINTNVNGTMKSLSTEISSKLIPFSSIALLSFRLMTARWSILCCWIDDQDRGWVLLSFVFNQFLCDSG